MVDKTFTTHFDAVNHTTTLTLTQPGSGNRLTGQDIINIAAAIREAGRDLSTKLIVLRAQGEQFCMGRIPDPKPVTPLTAFEVRNNVSTTIMELYASVRSAPVPVLGIIQGEARGFGCAFAGQCDITIASSRAVFSLPELDTNIPPTLAMSALLHRVPPKIIAYLVYTRAPISAAEARQFGLVSEVVEPGDLDAACARVIAGLADRPRAALGTIKEYLWSALYTDAAASAHLAQNMISVALSSQP